MKHDTKWYLKRAGFCCLALATFLVVGEMVARFVLGLGDPPLFIEDSEIEYIYAPNQDCRWRGMRIIYNNYSLRNIENLNTNEVFQGTRVLMMGDSVINGGLADHKNLAITLVQKSLQERCTGKFQVLNCSAGSWGPGNYAAYVRKYSDFNADRIGFVLSSHDVWDVPDFRKVVGVSISYPDKKPISACSEAVFRYFVPRVTRLFLKKKTSTLEIEIQEDKDKEQISLDALQSIIEPTRLRGADVFFIIHRTQNEWKSQKIPTGERIFRDFATKHGVPIYLLELDVNQDYHDDIHINNNGHRKLSNIIKAHIMNIKEVGNRIE